MASNGYLGCSGVIPTNYDFGTSYLFNYSMNVMLLLINNGISEFREFIGLNYPRILKNDLIILLIIMHMNIHCKCYTADSQ